MKVAEWAIPLLGCCALLYTLPTIKNGVKTKHYVLIAIAILSLGFTWWNVWDNSTQMNNIENNTLSTKEQLQQAKENIGALGWLLEEGEIAELDKAAASVDKKMVQNILQTK